MDGYLNNIRSSPLSVSEQSHIAFEALVSAASGLPLLLPWSDGTDVVSVMHCGSVLVLCSAFEAPGYTSFAAPFSPSWVNKTYVLAMIPHFLQKP